MGALRKQWVSAKATAEKDIKDTKHPAAAQATAKLLKSFNKGLGPKLDDVEKAVKLARDAKDAKTKDAKQKAAVKIVVDAGKIMNGYKKLLVEAKSNLLIPTHALLKHSLDSIQSKLTAYWQAPHDAKAADAILKP